MDRSSQVSEYIVINIPAFKLTYSKTAKKNWNLIFSRQKQD
jgi:murein L,D-transpeptidase YcbB/YkuD